MMLKTKSGKSYLSEFTDIIISSLDNKECTTKREVVRETMLETVLQILSFIKVNTTDEELHNPLVWKIVNWINYFGKWNPMVELCYRLNMLLCEKNEENINEIKQLIKDNVEHYPDRNLYWDKEISAEDRNLITFIKNNDFLFIPTDNQKDNPGIIIRRNIKWGGMKMVDLGLPSGTLWADRNLGANAPEQYGNYYRFGDAFYYEKYSPEHRSEDVGSDIAGTDSDAATVTLGKEYHTPTFEQFKELLGNCRQEWITFNGVNGVEVTGPNGNSVFFPAAGLRDNAENKILYAGKHGWYRSSVAEDNSTYCWCMEFSDNGWDYIDAEKNHRLPIRPVLNK